MAYNPALRTRNDDEDQAKPINWLITHQSDVSLKNLRDVETQVNYGEYVGSIGPHSLEMGAVWGYCKQRREKWGKNSNNESEHTDSKISGRETQILAIFSYKVVVLLFLCFIVKFKRFLLFYPVGEGLCVLKQMLLTETFRKITLATMRRVVWSREPQRGHGFCSEVGER